MIKLANNAKVLQAYVSVPDAEGTRSTGVVLAEWHTNNAAGTGEFVTWNVWEGDYDRCTFEAETGHYFAFSSATRSDKRQEAEIDFGKRLAEHLTANACMGLMRRAGYQVD